MFSIKVHRRMDGKTGKGRCIVCIFTFVFILRWDHTCKISTHSPSVAHADSITAYACVVCWNHTSVGKWQEEWDRKGCDKLKSWEWNPCCDLHFLSFCTVRPFSVLGHSSEKWKMQIKNSLKLFGILNKCIWKRVQIIQSSEIWSY